MTPTRRMGLATLLAAGMAATAWSAAVDSAACGKAPGTGRRKSFEAERKEAMERRFAALPAQERELARALEPLRDSLFRTMGDYRRKVRDGADPRSLTTERATIASLTSQIENIQANNRDVWLDLQAHFPEPGPGPRGPGRGHHPPPGPPMDQGDASPPQD